MTAGDRRSLRLRAAAAFLTAAFISSLAFHGTSTSLRVVAIGIALLLGSLVAVGARGLAEALERNRFGVLLALAMLGYLVVAYRLSLSPDNSFAASWVLASGPLAFLVTSAMVLDARARRVASFSMFAVVVALAVYSGARFVVFGERAHAPLVDPNNYAALMYLAWIPLVHHHLVGATGPNATASNASHTVLALAASFLLLLTIVATRSRASELVVFGAFGAWIFLFARMPTAKRWLSAHAGVALLAWLIGVAVTTFGHGSSKALDFGGGIATRGELLRAAFAMFEQHPFGIGVFCFSLLYPGYRTPAEQDTTGLFVHNDYVQFLTEGGVPLVGLVLAFVVPVARRCIALTRGDSGDRIDGAGLALALLAVCAHASINFVFYSFPLSIVIGVLAGLLFSPPASLVVPRSDVSLPVLSGGIVAAWVMWLYLVLDVAIVGVFQGQPSFPFVASIRGDEARMMQFARLAQRLNGSRGIPALGEGVLLYRAAQAEPGSAYLREQAYRQLRHALEIDPW
ncbi:MAG TPA: O-antigen ligase family protein, partial [Candidatus Acidoferrales bacterium]|nr:O-antigen ligase family protein [Candidatus Acidoferrales bacterium]